MISDMSWLISAWKAKVSTSSSAILVLVLVLGSDGREYEAQALEGCGERREPAKAGRRASDLSILSRWCHVQPAKASALEES